MQFSNLRSSSRRDDVAIGPLALQHKLEHAYWYKHQGRLPQRASTPYKDYITTTTQKGERYLVQSLLVVICFSCERSKELMPYTSKQEKKSHISFQSRSQFRCAYQPTQDVCATIGLFHAFLARSQEAETFAAPLGSHNRKEQRPSPNICQYCQY